MSTYDIKSEIRDLRRSVDRQVGALERIAAALEAKGRAEALTSQIAGEVARPAEMPPGGWVALR